MEIPVYQVDAFSSSLFGGNPAAICPLQEWLPDELMQNIAMENNLSETAFLVPVGDHFRIRWFTPKAEVALCGHATLAAAHVLFTELDVKGQEICFHSLSGELRVAKSAAGLQLDFPSQAPEPCEPPLGLLEALGGEPIDVAFSAEDFIVRYGSEKSIVDLQPDFNKLARTQCRGVAVTAPGDKVDFVSRFFAPAVGINEDPVTGSAHCKLTPLWAERLGKTVMTARQLSARGGELQCELKNDRVLMAGVAVTFLQGMVRL